MTNILWTSFELLVNVYQGILFTYFLWGSLTSKYTGRKNTILFVLCSFSYFTVVTIANFIIAFEGMVIFIYGAIFIAFSLYALNGSIFKKILVSIIPISILAICVVFSLNIIALIFDQRVVNLTYVKSVYRVLFIILSNTLMFILTYILKLLFKRENISLKKMEWIMLALVFSISIVIFIMLFFIAFNTTSDKEKLYIALSMLLIIANDLIVYFLLVQLSKKHKIELENNLLMQQYSFQKQSAIEVKNQYEQLQKVRHDYNNGLRIIQSLNSENKTKEIDDYIEKYLNSQNKTIHIVSTNNEFANAIINSKTAQANSNNIKVSLNVISDLDGINNLDFCNILGNMFDNAIEACNKCEKNKIIQLNISKDGDGITIFMKNSIDNSVIANNPELKTNKKDKSNHGYGTKIIKELAEKHHGFADFYEQDNMFCCNVILYNKI